VEIGKNESLIVFGCHVSIVGKCYQREEGKQEQGQDSHQMKKKGTEWVHELIEAR